MLKTFNLSILIKHESCLSVYLCVCVFQSHQKSQIHEILALGLIWANIYVWYEKCRVMNISNTCFTVGDVHDESKQKIGENKHNAELQRTDPGTKV